ncbi:MAG TPA: tail protein X [Candidatus Aphodousia faecavium]|nr:tail protein X [Candidatus Aphodousia faecavium]
MYKTVQGDTWDIISKKIYGTELQMHVLIVANPAARDVVIFPAGVELQTPVMTEKVAETLPPWKRG